MKPVSLVTRKSRLKMLKQPHLIMTSNAFQSCIVGSNSVNDSLLRTSQSARLSRSNLVIFLQVGQELRYFILSGTELVFNINLGLTFKLRIKQNWNGI